MTLLMYVLFRGYKATHKSENYKYMKAQPRPSDVVRPD